MKKNLLKAVLPASLALFAVTFGSCSQDGQLTGTKEDTGERVLDNTREIQNYLRTLPLAPMMSRASDPVPSDMVRQFQLTKVLRRLKKRAY